MEPEESKDHKTGASEEAFSTSLENAVSQKPTDPSGHVKGKAKMKSHFTVGAKKKKGWY